MSNVSKLRAIAEERCPRCRQGRMFKYSPFHPLRFDKMHEHCPHCGLQFEVEPGFFIASMYISYAMSVGTVLIVGFGVFYLAHDPPTWIYLLIVTIVLLLTVPLMFRYARVLLLHFFSGISYQSELS